LAQADLLRPRTMVVGEPTSLHPARAGKGSSLAEVRVHGKEAHSAHPSQGASAIRGAARLIVALDALQAELELRRNSLFDPAFTTFNVGTIAGGTAKNIVPSQCSFQLEWRPVPGTGAENLPARFALWIDAFNRGSVDTRAELIVKRMQPGFETAPDAPLVNVLESLTGRAPIAIPFGTEASIFASIAEQIVVFGPGDMRTAHSNRECVSIAELDEAVTCLGKLMTA
jgi:acetylornithine deacetylase